MPSVNSPRVHEIDISMLARKLAYLRRLDYLFILGFGSLLIGVPFELMQEGVLKTVTEIVIFVVIVLFMSYCFYLGITCTGTIAAAAWKKYRTVLWIMSLTALFFTVFGFIAVIAIGTGEVGKLETDIERQGVALLAFLLLPSAFLLFSSIRCLLAISKLRKARIPLVQQTVSNLVLNLKDRFDLQLTKRLKASARKINPTRGAILFVVGIVVLFLGPARLQLEKHAVPGMHSLLVGIAIAVVGISLVTRSLRYFQMDAQSLLDIDKRPPILFLRSFSDEDKIRLIQVQGAFIGLSVESRLANHFFGFGPFIGVGSPVDKLPQYGAARVQLPEEKWQAQVRVWMRQAQVIVAHVGNSYWFNWELGMLVQKGLAPKTIMLFRYKRHWLDVFRSRPVDLKERMKHLRPAFMNTPWQQAIDELMGVDNLRAAMFLEDGGIIAIRSSSRTNEAYHLAVLVAHYVMLTGRHYELEIRRGQQTVQHRLAAGKTKIGADSENDIVLSNDDYVSATHAEIVNNGSTMKVVDLNSRNGVLLPGSGKRLRGESSEIRPGDRFVIGECEMVLHLREHAPAPPRD